MLSKADKEDLIKLMGELLDNKFEEKLGPTLDEKLKPIQEQLEDVARDIKLATAVADDAMQCAEDAKVTADDARVMAEAAHRTVDEMALKLAELEKAQTKMGEQLMFQEAYSRRNNLTFEGIPESKSENLPQVMLTLIGNKLGLDVTKITLVGCHRIPSGPYIPPNIKTRPVIIKFLRHEDKKSVWQLRSKSPKGIWIKEDYPTEIDKRRNILWPYLNAAYQGGDPANPAARVSAYMILDKLHLNNQTYSYDTIEKIPKYVRDRVVNPPSSRRSDDVTVFFTKDSALSNFHPSKFTIKGQLYTSAEQFLTYQKCLLFDAKDVAADILKTVDPTEMQRKSRKIVKFSIDRWTEKSPTILYEALCAKFTQNSDLKDALLDTDNTQLGESSRDPFSGTGLPLRHSKALDVTCWSGENRQGLTLMKVRQEIREGTIRV